MAKIATSLRKLRENRSDVEEILYTVLLYLYHAINVEDHVQVKQEFDQHLQ
ncbi:MAG: hypothetical protein ACOX5R_05600 [bacterium]